MSQVRVLRVITRMNMGGPARHVAILGGGLDRDAYRTLLVAGSVGPGEESLQPIAAEYGAHVLALPDLNPELRPLADLRALAALVRIVRRYRPDVVHTHMAKAGTLGRIAALLAARPRPLLVHTYHGHVLEGYFGRVRTAVFRSIERALARVTDCVVCVSEATAGDIERLGIAGRDRLRVIPLGLDLEPFLAGATGAAFRRSIGAAAGDVVVLYVGRFVPIKRVDVLLRAFARARAGGAPLKLVLVGGGPLREQLERQAGELGVAAEVHFAGYRTDLAEIAAAADIAALTSENEGTPVFLIEAAAAGLPAVATAVGGVPDVVTAGTGALVEAGDEQGFADELMRLARDEQLRRTLGERAREHVRSRFSSRRLVSDVERLYGELLHARSEPEESRPAAAGT